MQSWYVIYQNPDTVRPGQDFPSLSPPGSQSVGTKLASPAQRLFDSLRREIKDERVIRAMERVPRDLFVPPDVRHMAYEDEALPLGEGQTVSQPFIVALMTSALGLKETDKVLEVGTGSGYQAAVLAQLAREVISVERKPALASAARSRLAALGVKNVQALMAGATLGWPREAPYNAIIVTAAAPRVPVSLLAQLMEGGRIVIPLGSRFEQELVQGVKRSERLDVRYLGGCRFVPLIGPDAWDE